ncbi:Putative RNA-binding protein 16 [Gryllus bimaculatus]|nr:Putative RNA-binding protein 16 [Gryllus bimaculatus]
MERLQGSSLPMLVLQPEKRLKSKSSIMDAVKAFNAELTALYEVKPPISKAKMTSITRGAIKAIKFYKHVVQSVEKFIQKCKPEYKVPGLYVIDSIVRQSRHQFGADKDVFAPRFAKNMQNTFVNLFKCPPEDKSKVIRVLNLWQKNSVFQSEVIQPLFDLADPNHPIHKQEITNVTTNSNGSISSMVNLSNVTKTPPSVNRTPTSLNKTPLPGSKASNDVNPAVWLNPQTQLDTSTALLQLSGQAAGVKFDKKLLDFDYGSEDDDDNAPSPQQQPQTPQAQHAAAQQATGLESILSNPEVMRQLQTLQQQMSQQQMKQEMEEKLRKLQEMKQQEEEFDKHLAQTVPNLPFAAECDLKPSQGEIKSQTPARYDQHDFDQHKPAYTFPVMDITQPPPGYPSQQQQQQQQQAQQQQQQQQTQGSVASVSSHQGNRNSPLEDGEQADSEVEFVDRAATTLWVGHLSKLVHQEELSDTFGEYGDIVSIDLIPPRGCAFICMNRRQDAYRALQKLKNHKLQGKAITLAWAPGRGVKGKEWKDYWEVDLGVSYIPWDKLSRDSDLDAVEEGGMIDEETLPDWLKVHSQQPGMQTNSVAPTEPVPNNDVAAPPPGFIPLPEGLPATTVSQNVDTTQPPPQQSVWPECQDCPQQSLEHLCQYLVQWQVPYQLVYLLHQE